ncbi:MAG: Rieske 2Fe-2S domain-containing protein [Chloroflexi bacterium]|nr:Rieske 2Fe-2S domain-containing protein [Chloroflexota bacterium]
MSEATASNDPIGAQDEQLAVNRREFLNLAWLASLGFLTLEVSGFTIAFAYPRFKEGEFGGIFTYGPVADLPEVNTSPLNYPKVKFWLSHTEEGIYALYKVCPHLGCLYGWSDQEFKFICPCHGSQYEYNGTYIQGPAPRSLDRFVIRIVDGQTGEELAVTPDDGGPVAVPDNPNAVIRVDTGAKIIGEVHD